MIALLQRVARARVDVDGRCVGAIDAGLLVFLCAERGDRERQAEMLLARLLAYRMFGDDAGRMNRSVVDVAGGVLLVPQFTLAADTRSGLRPSFTPAAPPAEARRLFAHFVDRAKVAHPSVETGIFGADMQVHLVNDGPVTFWLRADPDAPITDGTTT